MTKTEVRLLNTIHALALDRILFLCEHYKDKGYVTPSELSSFLSLVDDYQTSGGNSSLVNCAKSAVINLINTSVYTPNEYRLAMGMNKIINPLDARMEVEKMFTYVDMDFLNTRYSPSFDVQQSRILDSQAQCNATIMERLRYETQCKQTCCVPSYEFNDAVRNVYENMQAFYADNVQIETMSKAIDSFKVKKHYTIYDLDRLIFPEDPIRDWVEKRTKEIEKKFSWADSL